MLPTPLVLTGFGTALLAGAAVAFFLTHQVKIALYLGIAGGVLFLCAGVAFGYERMGEEKIKPVLLACQTDLSTVKGANVELQDSVTRIRAEVDDSNHRIAALSADTATAQGQAAAIRKNAEAQAVSLRATIAGYEAILSSAAQQPKTDAEAAAMLREVDVILTNALAP